MALSRKMLKEMGIEDACIEKIISAHAETVDALKRLKPTPGEDWKQRYDELLADYESFKSGVEHEKLLDAKRGALRGLLKECGVLSDCIEPIVRISLLDEIELGEDGSPVDPDGVKQTLSEQWRAFIPKTSVIGASVAAPPKAIGAKTYTKEDVRRMSYEEINRNYDKIVGDLKNSK